MLDEISCMSKNNLDKANKYLALTTNTILIKSFI